MTLKRLAIALCLLLALAGFGAPPARPAAAASGTVPNQPYAPGELTTRISPIMSSRQHNQPYIVNGYLFLGGNGAHELWDIADPYNPVKLSEMLSPHRHGEAEAHQSAFAKHPDGRLYAATTSGKGIDLWNITNAAAPSLAASVPLESINYGDNTNAVWGIAWQGDYIYVGGTNTGLHIVDARDPIAPRLVRRLPTSAFCGVSAGPTFAMGNVLIITTPKNFSGIATLDISDPATPALLDCVDPEANSYIGWFFGANVYLHSPFRQYDVLGDPANITLTGQDNHPRAEYMSFDEGRLFLGLVRGSRDGHGGAIVYNIDNPNALVEEAYIPGRQIDKVDDQFNVPVGNLVVISDDEQSGSGSWLAPYKAAPDTRPPAVLHIEPADGAVNQPTTSRIGVSFDSQVELASVGPASLIVRSVGGAPVTGTWGYTGTVLTFWPERPLRENTTYEVSLPAGGVTDLVGNPLAHDVVTTFTTGEDATGGGGVNACAITPPTPAPVGQAVTLSAAAPDTATYTWDFGDGTAAAGTHTTHTYRDPGRYPIRLSAHPPGAGSGLEAEAARLEGGISVMDNHAGHSGAGFADFPAERGSVTWQVDVPAAGPYTLHIRYANGSSTARALDLRVNGAQAGRLWFEPTGGWPTWGTQAAPSLELRAGTNTVSLQASAGTPGPNVDSLTVYGGADAITCAATQVVHRPLTPTAPTHSSSLIQAGELVWAVNTDAHTVSAVRTATGAKAFERAVGLTPRTLAQAPDGSVWVVNQGDDSISVLDGTDGHLQATIPLPYGSSPYGIAFAPDGSAAYVALAATGQLARLDPATRALTATLDLGPDASGLVPKVRGVAVSADSRRVLVTRFVSPAGHGQVYDVDAATLTLTRTLTLAASTTPDSPDGGRGVPNYLSALVISPDGTEAWLPSKQDNTSRGLFRDGLPLTHDTTVRPVVSRLDLGANAEATADRIDLNDANLPIAAAMSPHGDLLFVALLGNDAVDVIDAYSGQVIATIDVGAAPQGLALGPDGMLYAHNLMGRSLSIADVSPILSGADNSPGPVSEVDLVAKEALPPEVLHGKTLFYSAGPALSSEGYLSCASCHLDGGHDGRVWDFTDRGEGLRNTTTLLGRTGHGPAHWTGNFDELHDFENDIREAFGGTGLMSDADFNATRDPLGAPKAGLSADLDALVAYVASLDDVGRSPHRQAGGTLSPAAQTGQTLFESLDCAACHTGPTMTDSALGVLHDVGTIRPGSGQRVGAPLTGFDTPSLQGLWATAPYLHDGSADTLYDVINNPAHGDASTLSPTQQDELVAYLLQIESGASTLPDADPAERMSRPMAIAALIVLPLAAFAAIRLASNRAK